MSNLVEYALIVAGGKGTRMKSSMPKQFIELNGTPILIHTLKAFCRYSDSIVIVLVLPEEDFETWNALAATHHFSKPVILQKGGDSRFQSVRNGLNALTGEGLVAIHDGARPLVSHDIISASFRLAAVHKSAVAAVPLKESIRMTDQAPLPAGSLAPWVGSTKAMDRSSFHLIQTPQTFDLQLIKKAYQIKEDPSLTDDASVAERSGIPISLFEGSYENIKITTPEDLVVAEVLQKKKS